MKTKRQERREERQRLKEERRRHRCRVEWERQHPPAQPKTVDDLRAELELMEQRERHARLMQPSLYAHAATLLQAVAPTKA